MELCPGGAQSWWSPALVEFSWCSLVLAELIPGGAQSCWSSVLVVLCLVELSPGGAQSRLVSLIPCTSPLVVRIRVPPVVRMIWTACRRAPGDDFNDVRVWRQYLRSWGMKHW